MNSRTPLRIGLLLTTVSAASGVHADDYHYRSMLVGDRATGMGGAYTAVSDDASGLFYNPAGIVYAGGRNLSASVNAYNMTSTTYKDVLGGGDWVRESSALLPNFFGVIQPLGKGVVGFSYAVTDAIQENLDQKFSLPGIQNFVVNLNTDDSTYKLGPSYAQELGKGLAVGVTLYAHIRSSETILNQVLTGATYNDGQSTDGFELANVYQQSSEVGIEPVFGLVWSPLDKLAIGVSIRQNTVISSSLDDQVTCTTNIPSTQASLCHDAQGNPLATPQFNIQSISSTRPYPFTTSVGLAYFASDRLLYTADFVYYAEATGDEQKISDTPFRSRPAVWNASAGLEYYMDGQWALRGGLFTNNANTPQLTSGLEGQPEHIDMTGLSASLTRFTRSSSLTVGFSHVFGTGKAQAVGGTTFIGDAEATSTTLFLSTSYSY